MSLALGFIVISQQTILKAQDTVQGAKPGASAAEPPTAPDALSSAPLDDYLINLGDELDVYVFDVPELSRTYLVNPAGTIIVPLLPKPVQAAGLTSDQIARAMEEAFRQSGRLRHPEISVSVKQSRTRSVAVEGAVKTPQVLPMVWREKLVDAITQCGGLADDAGTYATITRGSLAMRDLALEGGPANPTLTVELNKVMDVTDPASTIEVWPGDRVSVARAGVFYVLGEVRSPGGYSLRNGRDQLTVLRALAMVGDATSVAKKSKAMIIRKDPKAPNGREEINLDLKSILAGRSPDPVLQADDILFVPGSGGKKALHTLTSVPATVVGGAASTAVIVH
ncbi:MAG: polysaccharide biosynthesis/export family protein [Terriglobia bacterium]